MISAAAGNSGGARLQAGDFSVIHKFLVAPLADNFHAGDLSLLEDGLLHVLKDQRRLSGVIFNFNAVVTTDRQDLQRFEVMLRAIRLLGCRIGICGINPGLAAVMIGSGIDFQGYVIGSDLDDLFTQL